jgi:hypothetical protein
MPDERSPARDTANETTTQVHRDAATADAFAPVQMRREARRRVIARAKALPSPVKWIAGVVGAALIASPIAIWTGVISNDITARPGHSTRDSAAQSNSTSFEPHYSNWRHITVDDSDVAFIESAAADGTMPWITQSSPSAIDGEAAILPSGCRNDDDPYHGQVTGTWRAVLPHAGVWDVSIHIPDVPDRKPFVDYGLWPLGPPGSHQILWQINQSTSNGWTRVAKVNLHKGPVSLAAADAGGGLCKNGSAARQNVVYDAARFDYAGPPTNDPSEQTYVVDETTAAP